MHIVHTHKLFGCSHVRYLLKNKTVHIPSNRKPYLIKINVCTHTSFNWKISRTLIKLKRIIQRLLSLFCSNKVLLFFRWLNNILFLFLVINTFYTIYFVYKWKIYRKQKELQKMCPGSQQHGGLVVSLSKVSTWL